MANDPLAFVRWLTIQNAGSDPIPPFGVVRITGVASAGDAFTVDAPNASGMVGILINGPGAVAPGSRGMAHATFPGLALYYTGDGTPAVGETWGTESGSYKLHSGQNGFKILGGVAAGKVCVQADWGGSGGGSLTAEEVDGSPSYGAITTLRFDQNDGFVLTQPGAGIARVDLAAATTSQAGIVSTSAQSLAGEKWFQATQVRVGGNISTYGQSAYYTDMSGGRVTGYEGGGVLYDIGPGTRGASFELIYNGAGAIYACLVKGSESTYAYAVWDGVSLYPGVTGVRSDGLTSVGGIVTALGSPSTYTDEQAQDAIGAMVGGTTGLAYTDSTPLLALDVSGLTVAEPAIGDEVAGYDASGAATRSFELDYLVALPPAVSLMRLTTETGVSVSTSDRTSQGTLYLTRHTGWRILVPDSDGSAFRCHHPSADISLSLSLVNGNIYDVFLWNNAGTLTLALSAAWASVSSRTDALSTLNGIYVNGVAAGSMGVGKGLWVGTIGASGTNVTEDSDTRRYVWNTYNRVTMPLRAYTDAYHTYGTASYRYWGGSISYGANAYQFIFGATSTLTNHLGSLGYASSASQIPTCQVALDDTPDSDLGHYVAHYDVTTLDLASSFGAKPIAAGYHYVGVVQYSFGGGSPYYHDMRLNGFAEF